MNTRGGSRISRGGAWTHFGGGAWTSDTHTHFLVKMYVKTKELGPVVGGGVHRKILYVDPPCGGENGSEIKSA